MLTRMTSSSSVVAGPVVVDLGRDEKTDEQERITANAAALAVRLNEKTAEEQNAENDDYRDDDDLDQTHG